LEQKYRANLLLKRITQEFTEIAQQSSFQR
jgi:hypothetical protein